MTKQTTTASHPARSELAALLWTRRQLIRDHALAAHDAGVERAGVSYEYFVKPFDEAKDWLGMTDITLEQRRLRHQRIPRLPRSIYGPKYYMSLLVTNAQAITAKSGLLDDLPNSGRGTQ